MKKSEYVLDKLSWPKNHPMVVSMNVMTSISGEIHINDLLLRIMRKRKSSGNVIDEARILRAIGLLIAMDKVEYYKGLIRKI